MYFSLLQELFIPSEEMDAGKCDGIFQFIVTTAASKMAHGTGEEIYKGSLPKSTSNCNTNTYRPKYEKHK